MISRILYRYQKTNFNIIKLICISLLSVLSILYIVSISHRYHFTIDKHHKYEDLILHIFMFWHLTNELFVLYVGIVDTSSHMYTTEAIKLFLICARHIIIFYWYWQYCINIYRFIILKYHNLYIIRQCCCFNLVSI